MDSALRYIFDRTGEQFLLMKTLHDLVMSYPGVHSAIRYTVPFYGRNRWICYMNPLKDGGIELCFVQGYRFGVVHELLQRKGRKQIIGISIDKCVNIPLSSLGEILAEAWRVDLSLPPPKSRRKTGSR